MAITSRAQDKYAFLFTGPTQARFMADLENVYATLTNYYNYPAANIRVVVGSSPSVLPSFPFVTIASLGDLTNELTSFKTLATGPALPGLSKSALFYFTGGGDNTGGSKLLTDGAAASATNTVDTAWLAPHLAITDCQVNVVMQQAFAGGFSAVVTDPESSFTSACTSTENSVGNPTDGSFFTYGWCKGLKYEALPPTTPSSGDYAEDLGPTVGEPNNGMVSMRKAMEFGTQIQGFLGFGAFGTPACVSASPQHLGQPSFLIRDSVSPWWESPDIYLTHPNDTTTPDGDLYIPDAPGAMPLFNNTITIKVRNTGTHPVRRYSLGIELFKSGIGVVNDQNTIADKLVSSGVLLPLANLADIDTAADRVDIAEWNTPFTQGTTHECIKAEAKLAASSIDFIWSILANDYEAQRNTDELPMAMEPPATTQLPAAEIRGPKQHEYGLFNRFDEPRRYAVVFPRDYERLTAGFELAWFEKAERGDKLTPARVVNLEGRQSFIVVTLQPREERTLVLRAKPVRGAKAVKESRVPFAILVEERPAQNARLVDADPALIGAVVENDDRILGAIAGFTVILRHAAATLAGTVLDRKGRPAANATITVATVNGTARAAVTTDANGRYELRDVNPDVYRVTAETPNWRSATQTLAIGDRQPAKLDLRLTEDATPAGTRVKVIVDRIRIKRDGYESKIKKIKGKAEVAFTTTVVPDFNDGAKQVTRLPAKGAMPVSGKPGLNEIPLGMTVFEGVVKGDGLSITIDGKKLDLIDRDEKLASYKRTFSGSPETWAGNYQPGDEAMDREDVGEWGVWYRIVT